MKVEAFPRKTFFHSLLRTLFLNLVQVTLLQSSFQNWKKQTGRAGAVQKHTTGHGYFGRWFKQHFYRKPFLFFVRKNIKSNANFCRKKNDFAEKRSAEARQTCPQASSEGKAYILKILFMTPWLCTIQNSFWLDYQNSKPYNWGLQNTVQNFLSLLQALYFKVLNIQLGWRGLLSLSLPLIQTFCATWVFPYPTVSPLQTRTQKSPTGINCSVISEKITIKS